MDDALEAKALLEQARELEAAALNLRRTEMQQLRDEGWTYRALGAKFGVSYRRVPQILNGNAPPKNPRSKSIWIDL